MEEASALYEISSEKDADLTNATLATDYMRIIGHPAIAPLIDIDMDDEEVFGQTKMHAQQAVLCHMFTEGVRGNFEDMSSKELMNSAVAYNAERLTLRSANEFCSVFSAYAQAQGVTNRRQSENIIKGAINHNITLMTQDIIQLYKQGLITPEGDPTNLYYVGRIMRFMDVTLLFSRHLRQPDAVASFYDKLYQTVVGEHPGTGQLNHAAQQYVMQYGKQVTRGSSIRTARTQAGPKVDEITNRAGLMPIFGNAKANLIQAAQSPGLRRKYANAIRAIGYADDLALVRERIVGLVDRLEVATSNGQTDPESITLTKSITQATHLKWEVLPPGAGELEEKARTIVGMAQHKPTEVAVDLERLLILENIRKQWGEKTSYYAYGTLGKRRVIKKDGQEAPDQYLLLVLQDTDAEGVVRQEHAIAESPIAGQNALYVFRQDVSEGLNWSEVMALPKSYARALRARAIRHTQPRHAPQGYLVASMTEKVRLLLTCLPEDFLSIEFDGNRYFNFFDTIKRA